MFNSTFSATSPYASSTFSAINTPSPGTPNQHKEKRFYDWHSKQGISAPQDYPTFAAQPAPFSNVPQQNTFSASAASPYLQKVITQNAVNIGSPLDREEAPESRRKSTLKKTASSSPPATPGANWPKSMFGSRPPSRTRNRSSATPDDSSHHAIDTNLPPLASIYDSLPFEPSTASTKHSESSGTATQVRVANYTEDRFPDLIQALRRYYGPILEPYSGLPKSESKFYDPEIIPREKLDLTTLRMIQPLAGADGGGLWVRITFANREAAERAVASSELGELVIGGNHVRITMWDESAINDAPLPFTSSQMDIDPPTSPVLQRNNTPLIQTQSSHIRRTSSFPDDSSVETGGAYSEHMPGAKLVPIKPVEFAKKEGWLSGWTSSIASAPKTVAPNAPKSWGQAIGGTYHYVMDELVGFKYL